MEVHSPMATALTRWDPSADFAAMRNVMDRLFEQPLTRLPFRAGEDLGNPTLSLDVIENGDTFVIKAAVPGVDPKDVEISVDEDVLSIRGKFCKQEESTEENYLRREIRYGSFQRQLRLWASIERHLQGSYSAPSRSQTSFQRSYYSTWSE